MASSQQPGGDAAAASSTGPTLAGLKKAMQIVNKEFDLNDVKPSNHFAAMLHISKMSNSANEINKAINEAQIEHEQAMNEQAEKHKQELLSLKISHDLELQERNEAIENLQKLLTEKDEISAKRNAKLLSELEMTRTAMTSGFQGLEDIVGGGSVRKKAKLSAATTPSMLPPIRTGTSSGNISPTDSGTPSRSAVDTSPGGPLGLSGSDISASPTREDPPAPISTAPPVRVFKPEDVPKKHRQAAVLNNNPVLQKIYDECVFDDAVIPEYLNWFKHELLGKQKMKEKTIREFFDKIAHGALGKVPTTPRNCAFSTLYGSAASFPGDHYYYRDECRTCSKNPNRLCCTLNLVDGVEDLVITDDGGKIIQILADKKRDPEKQRIHGKRYKVSFRLPKELVAEADVEMPDRDDRNDELISSPSHSRQESTVATNVEPQDEHEVTTEITKDDTPEF